jgi:hypothetical protein
MGLLPEGWRQKVVARRVVDVPWPMFNRRSPGTDWYISRAHPSLRDHQHDDLVGIEDVKIRVKGHFNIRVRRTRPLGSRGNDLGDPASSRSSIRQQLLPHVVP